MLEKYAQFRPVLPSERSWRTFEMVVIASSFGGEANPFLSPDLLATTHVHGHCGILASRAGPFWVANHRHPPPWSVLQGTGAHRVSFSGARPSLCGGGAGSRIWVTGEGRPAFHPLRLLPPLPLPQKVGGGSVGNGCRTEPPPPSPPNAHLVPAPAKCTREDSLPQEMLL